MSHLDPAPRSIGLMMLLYAVVAVGFALNSGMRPGPLGYAVSGALAVGGVLMVLRLPVAYWVALAAGLFTAAVGVASVKWLPIGLRVASPPVVIVVGLYVCLRVAIARSALASERAEP